MALEGLLKQRVVSLTQIDERFFLNAGNDAIKGVGKTHHGAQIINVGKEVLRMQHCINVWANLGWEFLKNANHFATLLCLEFTNLIVGFNNSSRFNENSLPCGRFIMDNATNLALYGGRNGDNEATISQSGWHVALNVTLLLRLLDNATQRVAQRTRIYLNRVANGEQFLWSGVLHLTIFVEHIINALYDVRERLNVACKSCQSGVLMIASVALIFIGITLSEKFNQGMNGNEWALEVEKVNLFQMGALGA